MDALRHSNLVLSEEGKYAKAKDQSSYPKECKTVVEDTALTPSCAYREDRLEEAVESGDTALVLALLEEVAQDLQHPLAQYAHNKAPPRLAMLLASFRDNLPLIEALEERYSRDVADLAEAGLLGAVQGAHPRLVQRFLDMLEYNRLIAWGNLMAEAARTGDRRTFDVVVAAAQDDPLDWNNVLVAAVQGGNMGIVTLLLSDDRGDVNTALEAAAERGNLRMINELIRWGADDWQGALLGAAEGGDQELVRVFLDRLGDGEEPLWQLVLEKTAYSGNIDLLNYVWNLARHHIEADWEAILYQAARGGSREMIDVVAQYVDNPDEIISLGAAAGNHVDLVSQLNERTLTEAAAHGSLGVTIYLLENGVPVTEEAARQAQDNDQRDILNLFRRYANYNPYM